MMRHQNSNPSALVIEDEPQLASIFAEALQEVGCNPQTISDGNMALQLLAARTTPLNVILLDLNLPNVSGEQILQSIRENELLKGTLVILTTANSRAASYLQYQVDYVLLKPISYTQLRALLNRLCPAHNGILVKKSEPLLSPEGGGSKSPPLSEGG